MPNLKSKQFDIFHYHITCFVNIGTGRNVSVCLEELDPVITVKYFTFFITFQSPESLN